MMSITSLYMMILKTLGILVQAPSSLSHVADSIDISMFAYTVLPPQPEPIQVIELALPPAITSNSMGACTIAMNPRRTGCLAQFSPKFQAGDFTPDGDHVVISVEFVGAPPAPDVAAIYTGEQLLLVKADGTAFDNGDTWKCLSCGVPPSNAESLDAQKDYPHAFRSGRKVLWGHNILECGGEVVTSNACTPEKTHIYPIYWSGGSPRELRLHPDDSHLAWSSFTNTGGQFAYFGRLQFNQNPTSGTPLAPRYDLVHVNLLVQPNGKRPIEAVGNELQMKHDAITVGELRGFNGVGDEMTYIGFPQEANNIDVFAVHVETGAVRRLTSHPEYTDPVAFSYNGQWMVIMDTRGSDRQMWMSGMRGIPAIVDLITVAAAASTRNNGARRFFQPILLDRWGDRGDYFGQRVNADGDGSPGSPNDANWNGRADPAFSPDGTRIVYWQTLVVPPACGGVNPLPCPNSTAQGGRTYRLMLAHLTGRKPETPPPVFPIVDVIPWATPYTPDTKLPRLYTVPAGEYTLAGRITGIANISLTANPSNPTSLETVAVNYTNFSDDGEHIIDGWERVTVAVEPSSPWGYHLDWYTDIVQTGKVDATKATSPGGYHLDIDVLTNIFEANGTLQTTIDGVVYRQPKNGT